MGAALAEGFLFFTGAAGCANPNGEVTKRKDNQVGVFAATDAGRGRGHRLWLTFFLAILPFGLVAFFALVTFFALGFAVFPKLFGRAMSVGTGRSRIRNVSDRRTWLAAGGSWLRLARAERGGWTVGGWCSPGLL